jgi:hypothetical protein
MRRRSAVTTAALSFFGVVLAACAIPEAPGPFDPGSSVEPSTATPTTTGESMEGTYTYEEMGEYVDVVVNQLILPWLDETWPSMVVPEVLYVEEGDSGPEGCVDHTGEPAYYSDESYEYCSPDVTVYLGQSMLWDFYTLTGDAGPAMGIAHEFGHHIQHELDVPSPFTPAQSVVYENQADCIAGAWAQWTDHEGYLETEDDLEDIEALFPLIASAEGEDRDHGTQEEREEAFIDGFRGGVTACGISAG